MYFPTETESKLDFIVQGPFRTTPNRSSIPSDDADNVYLTKETAILLRESILEMKADGRLNMSFVKALPIDKDRFDTFGLFLPLYETVRDLFRSTAVIPTKAGKYVHPKYAKIARQERLVSVFSDELLTQLINDGGKYCWLPTFLTETNREYKHVLDYMTGELGVQVIRPEDLRGFFASNPKFLPAQSIDWLVNLYGIFENIPGAFSKSRYETNMTTADIVKTATGTFVAPFRREGKTYIPNVFLPSHKIRSADINFVDATLYERCRHFFDDILQLQKPNEYEFLIKDIKKRYESGHIYDDDQHIEDIKALFKYSKREEYEDEVNRIIRELLALRCTDGKMRSCYAFRIFLPISTEGINIESYYRNLGQNVFFADVDFYNNHGIETPMLLALGVRNSITIGDNTVSGTYETGSRGKQPEWWTTGDFRWKFSTDALKDVLKYISAHPSAKDSILKSQAIMKVLTVNESRLCGLVHIGGSTVPNKENEPCEMIHILRGERIWGWDGKWLYTESGELVSPKAISKHDISTSIYGRIKLDSVIFSLIGFKKTDADEVDELKKTIPQEKLEAYFESELRQRYGISTADLNERYGSSGHYESIEEDAPLPFPTLHVRSWEALRKHAAEMLIYADPVRYEEKIRSIRVSNHQREAKAYGYLPAVKKIDGVKYSVQHINAFHSSLSKFLRDFGGVSTKYLQGYLYLFTYKYSRGSSLFTPSAYLDILKTLVRPGHYLPADELKERYQTLVSHSIGNKKLAEFSPIQIEMYARYTKGEEKVDICAEFEIAEKEFDKLIKRFEADERTANLAVRWYEREKEELIKEREHLQKALDRQRRKESILADYDAGMTMREIAPKYGITFQRVGQIIKDEKEKGWVTKRPVYIPKVKIKKVRPRRRTIEDKIFRMYQELREKKPKATQAQIATLIAEELGRKMPTVNAMISTARIKRGEKRKRTIVPKNTIPKIIADFEKRCKESTPEHPLTYQIIHKELAIKYGIKFSTMQSLLIRHYQAKGQKEPELSYRKPMPMSEVRKCRTNYDSTKKIPDRIRRKILEEYKLRMKSRGYKPERNPLRAELAKEFGVTKTTIARITRNERQKFIQEQESED